MRWILDDGPFGHLASIRPSLTQAWRAGVLLVAETTARSMLSSKPDVRELSRVLLEPGEMAEPVIGRFEVRYQPGSPDWDAYVELHPDSGDLSDQAEHESIAWAQTVGLDAVFICADKMANMLALAELGKDRVGHAFDLWINLFQERWLTEDEFARLCWMTYRHVEQSLPRLPERVKKLLSLIPEASPNG